MKNSLPLSLLLFILAAFAFCLPASAIIVADYGVATSAPTNEGSGDWDINWDYVYKYKNSSAVAVGSHWLLTAAHVGDDGGTGTVVVNGTNYYQQEVIFHLGSDDPEHANQADLALVRFDKEFPGYYPLYTGGFPSVPAKNKLDAIMIGYGRTGTVYNTYYNEVSSGNGIKRWGSQKVDGIDTANYDVGGTTGMTYNDGIQMLFTLSGTPYEAGVGVYDSGGGTFVEEGGVWKLAGINTIRYGTEPDYIGTFGVSVPEYATWINNMMAAADGDDDSDGIPNWWEEQYGSTTGVVASVDQDGDGAVGTDEYIVDTDPTDSNSVWQVDGAFVTTNQTFTFDGSTARQYQVFYTTNDLVDPDLTWTAHGSPIWGTGAGTEITLTHPENRAFYYIRVTLP